MLGQKYEFALGSEKQYRLWHWVLSSSPESDCFGILRPAFSDPLDCHVAVSGSTSAGGREVDLNDESVSKNSSEKGRRLEEENIRVVFEGFLQRNRKKIGKETLHNIKTKRKVD